MLGHCRCSSWGKEAFASLIQVMQMWHQWVPLVLHPLLSGCRVKEVHIGLPSPRGRIGWQQRLLWYLPTPRPDPLFLLSSSAHSLPPPPENAYCQPVLTQHQPVVFVTCSLPPALAVHKSAEELRIWIGANNPWHYCRKSAAVKQISYAERHVKDAYLFIQ